MPRLFFIFAHGASGVGLLLIRLVAGTALVAHGTAMLAAGPSVGRTMFYALSCGLGLLLLAGLYTSIAGTVVLVFALWEAHAYCLRPWYCISLAILGAALALLGPGAWSVDARRLGWRRLEIPDQKGPNPPSA